MPTCVGQVIDRAGVGSGLIGGRSALNTPINPVTVDDLVHWAAARFKSWRSLLSNPIQHAIIVQQSQRQLEDGSLHP
jgi:hypothetical protein